MSTNLCFLQNLPQNRHPERSASQIYRVKERLGAESKDPGCAYPTHAARSLSTTEARTGRTRCGLEDFAQTWGWKMITVHEETYP